MSIFSLRRDSSTEVIIKIVQRWTKNNKDPENSVYALTILTAPRSQTDTGTGSRFQLTSTAN